MKSVKTFAHPKVNSNSTKPAAIENVSINVASAFGFEASKGKSINIKVNIKCTNEKFNISKFPFAMKVRDLKGLLEFVSGIPFNLQKLSYLDDGEMLDEKDIQYYDLIDGALIIIDIWTIYANLVQAAVRGNIEEVLKQGVSNKVEWKSPTSDYMFSKDRTKYIDERSGIALFIAAHRGHFDLVKTLVAHGANINYTSSFGRTPVMVSVVVNRIEIIDYLLDNNADIETIDYNGDSALTISKKFNNKLGQHRLTQFKWKKRTDEEMKNKGASAKQILDEIFPEKRLPHQVFDSSKKTWFKGDFMQMYMMQLVPLSEYSGGNLSAPKSIGKEVLRQHRFSRSTSELKNVSMDDNGDLIPIDSGLTFDKWLAQKKKSKWIQEQQKKKKEAREQAISDSKEENIKESLTISSDSDANIWMKDYLRTNNRTDIPSELNSNSTRKFLNKLSENSNYSFGQSSFNRKKSMDMPNIYKGMSYDEWTKIRDQFLKSHNMM